MTDARVLLERHKPRLVYDSHEAYFADSAAIWTDSPTNMLSAPTARLAKPPKLEPRLSRPAHLRGRHEGAGRRRDRRHHPRLRRNAAAMHKQRRATATASTATPGRRQGPPVAPVLALLLLQRLPAGRPALSGGKHEGDWELVQSGSAPRAARAGRLLPAQDGREQGRGRTRPKQGDTPLVYVARGSHANYFSAGLALDRHLVRPGRRQGPEDHADARGRRRQRSPPGLLWPGHWGDTKAGLLPLDSAARPARAGAPHWLDPSSSTAPSPSRRPPRPRRRRPTAHRSGDTSSSPTTPTRTRPRSSSPCAPRAPTSPPPPTPFQLDQAKGTVEIPAGTATTTSGRASCAARPRRLGGH